MHNYELTNEGRNKITTYISEMKAKRKEIMDAGKDTIDETNIDYTVEELFEDLLDFGIDDDGDIYDNYGVTDNYDMDYPLGLTLGIDFVEVTEL